MKTTLDLDVRCPAGWKVVAVRKPTRGELVLKYDGMVEQWYGSSSHYYWPIVEKTTTTVYDFIVQERDRIEKDTILKISHGACTFFVRMSAKFPRTAEICPVWGQWQLLRKSIPPLCCPVEAVTIEEIH